MEKSSPLVEKLEFIKSPVVAEFLGFTPNTSFTETDLESSIISNLQKFRKRSFTYNLKGKISSDNLRSGIYIKDVKWVSSLQAIYLFNSWKYSLPIVKHKQWNRNVYV